MALVPKYVFMSKSSILWQAKSDQDPELDP